MTRFTFVVLALAVATVACAQVQPTSQTQPAGQLQVADRSEAGARAATPAPEPAQTPEPVLVPPTVPRPVAPVSAPLRPPTPQPPPAPRWRVVGPGVDAPIAGSYGDCSGQAAVGWAGAYFDTCQPGTWLMAHPTFFGAMNSWPPGTAVTVYDGNGSAVQYYVVQSHVYAPGSSGFQVTGAAHFQVCTSNTANSTVRVLDAA